MIEFDWSSPEARAHMERSLQVIREVGEMDGVLQTDLDAFATPGSRLDRLSEEFNEAPISLTHSLRAALTASRGALDQVSGLLQGGASSYRIILQAALRSALLGAGRVIFVLGPTDEAQRRDNARTVLRQEGASLMRGLNSFSKFQHLPALTPPDGFYEDMRRRNDLIQEGGGRRDDTLILDEMALFVGRALTASHPGAADDVGALSEHVKWIWQTYSGEVHGFGWPAHMSGDFVADLGMTVGVVQLAFDFAIKSTQV